MKKLYCDSDIGSCLIGNKDWTYAVPNIGGDGKTKIFIFEKNGEEFKRICEENNLEFLYSAQGTFNIYSYDCAFPECKDENIIATLSGKYQIFRGEWLVVFLKIK